MKEDFELFDTALEISDKLTTKENLFAMNRQQSVISQQKTSEKQFEDIIKRQSEMLQEFFSLQIVSQQEGNNFRNNCKKLRTDIKQSEIVKVL